MLVGSVSQNFSCLEELDFCSRIILLLIPESQYLLLKGLLETDRGA